MLRIVDQIMGDVDDGDVSGIDVLEYLTVDPARIVDLVAPNTLNVEGLDRFLDEVLVGLVEVDRAVGVGLLAEGQDHKQVSFLVAGDIS